MTKKVITNISYLFFIPVFLVVSAGIVSIGFLYLVHLLFPKLDASGWAGIALILALIAPFPLVCLVWYIRSSHLSLGQQAVLVSLNAFLGLGIFFLLTFGLPDTEAGTAFSPILMTSTAVLAGLLLLCARRQVFGQRITKRQVGSVCLLSLGGIAFSLFFVSSEVSNVCCMIFRNAIGNGYPFPIFERFFTEDPLSSSQIADYIQKYPHLVQQTVIWKSLVLDSIFFIHGSIILLALVQLVKSIVIERPRRPVLLRRG